MFNIHVISDLMYGFNEPTTPEDEIIPPEADLVVFNGNLGTHPKRSILYAYKLAQKYPDVQFVYNLGVYERYWRIIPKYEYEREDNIAIRISSGGDWLPNLHWKDPRSEGGLLIKLRTGQTIDVFAVYGFPKIHSYEGAWEDTFFYQNHSVCFHQKDAIEWWDDKPKETSYVSFGALPIWATKEWVNEKYEEMNQRIKKWEVNLKNYGVLVTHLSPMNDSRLVNIKTSPYLIHLDKLVWITAHDKINNVNYLGAKLYSNPGRGSDCRSQIITADK
jgi:hypothetical protein